MSLPAVCPLLRLLTCAGNKVCSIGLPQLRLGLLQLSCLHLLQSLCAGKHSLQTPLHRA